MNNLFVRTVNLFKNPIILLSIILILGFGIRLYKIDSPIADWHSWRQADTASVTRIFVDRGLDLLHPRYYDISKIQTGFFNPQGYRMVEFPIYNLIHYLVFTAGSSLLTLELAGRLTSVFVALVSAVAIFIIGRETIGKYGGVAAAFFYLFIPYNIYFTRVILPDPMGVMFALLGCVAYLGFEKRKNFTILYLSALLFALSILIKPFFAFYLAFPLYLLHKLYGKQLMTSKYLIKTMTFVGLSVLPFFVWRIWENKFPLGIAHFEWAFNGDGIRFRPAFFRWIFVERIGNLILGVWGLIPFAFGLAFAKTDKQKANVTLFLGGLIYVTLVATANVRHDYYQIPLIPVLALLSAQGFVFVWQNFKNTVIPKALLIFSVAMMLLTGWYQVREFYKINKPEILLAGSAVDRLVPKDALVIAPYNGDAAFLYQTNRFGWPVVDDDITKMIQRGANYFISVNFADPDTIAFEKRFVTIERTGSYILLDLNQEI